VLTGAPARLRWPTGIPAAGDGIARAERRGGSGGDGMARAEVVVGGYLSSAGGGSVGRGPRRPVPSEVTARRRSRR
jgi:hypothetical protein